MTYVKQARAFLDTADLDVISWTAGVKRYVFHKTDYRFAVEEVSGGSGPGIIKSFFRSNLKDKNQNLLTPYEWVRRRGYTGPAF